MSKGLIKAKKYNWKDTNLALFGSDTEKEVKKSAALSETAWKGVGLKAGLKVWRIINFNLVTWDEKRYGEFYSGDSYIILNTYKPDPSSEELAYDVFFWIGKYSSQDEYGTAAYKTVELDTFLDDKAVQHREVQGHESQKFKSYFNQFVVLEGGAASGFRVVEQKTYSPRLLHFSGQGSRVTVREVPFSQRRLVSGDVFILDLGNKFYQWNGKDSSGTERFKAAGWLAKIRGERGVSDYEVLEEADISMQHQFYEILPDEDVEADEEDEGSRLKLLRISDSSGSIEMELVKDEDVSLSDFDSNDVFLVDTGKQVFVWIGSKASSNEKKNGIPYAHNYLAKTGYPYLPISVIREGQKDKDFSEYIRK